MEQDKKVDKVFDRLEVREGQMTRDEIFGRAFAVLEVLMTRVSDSKHFSLEGEYFSKFMHKPAKFFKLAHERVMQNVHKFGTDEMALQDMLDPIIHALDCSDFTDVPLSGKALYALQVQRHALNSVMGVDEASKLWGLAPGTVKNYCAEGKIEARKIGTTWVIAKCQNNPSKRQGV